MADRASHGHRSEEAPTSAAAPLRPPLQEQGSLSRATTERTLLFVLVGLAIALLAAGALPGSSDGAGPAATAARNRAAVTAAGFALVVAAVIAAFLN